MRARYRAGKRLDTKSVLDVLQAVRALPFVDKPSFAVSRNITEVGKLEREIFLAATPGAYSEEIEVKHGGWQKSKMTAVYDGRGKPVIFCPGYLSSLDEAWRLIQEAAPGIEIACEFLRDGNLQIISVCGPSKKSIEASWHPVAPAHALMIAMLEYLAALSVMQSEKPRRSRSSLLDGGSA